MRYRIGLGSRPYTYAVVDTETEQAVADHLDCDAVQRKMNELNKTIRARRRETRIEHHA